MAKKTLRGALVGFGQVARMAHAPAYLLREDIEIVAVADSHADGLRAAAGALPRARRYEDLSTLLESEDSLDFIDIAAPPRAHADLILIALRRGLHVLCEKPLVLTLSDLEEIESLAKKYDLAVFCVHNWAHAPIWLKLAGLVASGAIGTVDYVELHALRTQPASAASGWRTDPRLSGGGILIDHGWHNLYLIRRLIKGPLRSVSAALRRPEDGSADEVATVLLSFDAGQAVMHLSWRAASRANGGTVHGDQGRLELRDDTILLMTPDGKEEPFPFTEKLSAGSAHPEWFSSLLTEFLAEINDPLSRGKNIRESRFCLEVIRKAYAACPVSASEVLGRR